MSNPTPKLRLRRVTGLPTPRGTNLATGPNALRGSLAIGRNYAVNPDGVVVARTGPKGTEPPARPLWMRKLGVRLARAARWLNS